MGMNLVDAFRWQAQACGDLGSPMYGALLQRVADDLDEGTGCIAEVLRGHEHDTGPSALALRLVGAVHRQVLQGDAADLAPYYPSAGGVWDLGAAWPHFLATVECRAPQIRDLLDIAPQTNEVGRASALMGGLLHIAARHSHPVRLFEIGCSGGLNLRADHFRYLRADGHGWGPPRSPVVLDPAWQGAPLPDGRPEIVERVGSDVAPVDVNTPKGRTALLSYVWPDQVARFARLQGALEVADQVPVEIRRAGAVQTLEDLRLQPGTTTVLWHSVMWQYLGHADQAAAQSRIEALAADADEGQPFAHLLMEPQRRAPEAQREFLVVLEMWPDGGRRVLGVAAPHGVPVTWE